jgi:hypothetical protein
MLGAWLIRRLGWQLKRVTKNHGWKIDADNVTLTLKRNKESDTPIADVVIHSQIDGKQAEFSARRMDDKVVIVADAPDVPSVSRTVRAPSPTLAVALSRVLDLPGRDTLYYDTLAVIRKLMEQIEGKL